MSQAPANFEDELYREIILDHWRTPRHWGEVTPADARVEGSNPLCGDEVLLTVRFDDAGGVADIAFSGQGCSISRASASLMCEGVAGQPRTAATELLTRFRAMMTERVDDGDLGDLEALRGVASMPARVKCAVLPWNALARALEGGHGVVSTEADDLLDTSGGAQ